MSTFIKTLVYRLGWFALIFTAVSIVLLVALVLVPYQCFPLSTSDRLSAAQIVVEISGFAILIYQFYRERTQELRRADVMLGLSPVEGEPRTYVRERNLLIAQLPSQGGDLGFGFDLLLENTGDAPVEKFRIVMNFPEGIFDYEPLKGKDYYGMLKYPIGQFDITGRNRCEFLSGDLSVPPGDHLRLGPFIAIVGREHLSNTPRIIRAEVHLQDGRKPQFEFSVMVSDSK